MLVGGRRGWRIQKDSARTVSGGEMTRNVLKSSRWTSTEWLTQRVPGCCDSTNWLNMNRTNLIDVLQWKRASWNIWLRRFLQERRLNSAVFTQMVWDWNRQPFSYGTTGCGPDIWGSTKVSGYRPISVTLKVTRQAGLGFEPTSISGWLGVRRETPGWLQRSEVKVVLQWWNHSVNCWGSFLQNQDGNESWFFRWRSSDRPVALSVSKTFLKSVRHLPALILICPFTVGKHDALKGEASRLDQINKFSCQLLNLLKQ